MSELHLLPPIDSKANGSRGETPRGEFVLPACHAVFRYVVSRVRGRAQEVGPSETSLRQIDNPFSTISSLVVLTQSRG